MFSMTTLTTDMACCRLADAWTIIAERNYHPECFFMVVLTKLNAHCGFINNRYTQLLQARWCLKLLSPGKFYIPSGFFRSVLTKLNVHGDRIDWIQPKLSHYQVKSILFTGYLQALRGFSDRKREKTVFCHIKTGNSVTEFQKNENPVTILQF